MCPAAGELGSLTLLLARLLPDLGLHIYGLNHKGAQCLTSQWLQRTLRLQNWSRAPKSLWEMVSLHLGLIPRGNKGTGSV